MDDDGDIGLNGRKVKKVKTRRKCKQLNRGIKERRKATKEVV